MRYRQEVRTDGRTGKQVTINVKEEVVSDEDDMMEETDNN